MTPVTQLHNVSLVLYPVNNDRTAWRPFGLPVILVEPDRRDPNGNPVELSQVQNVRIVIEDVPQKAAIAGQDHIGMFFPDKELFARDISTQELYERLIQPNGQRFFKIDGTEIEFADAKKNDLMQYTTRTGIRDTITYIPSANYYDLSDFLLDTEELPPDYYILRYSADYFVRVTSGVERDELICIDGGRMATAMLRFTMNHPGQTIEEQVRSTPQPYFNNANKSEDTTVAFYRPFTDALQDIFDESVLLESVNWVDKITPDFVPYLAYLLGLNIPFFPESLDRLRKVMLRNIVRLQQLKGSRRAVIDLFNLFGFNVFLINLYWSKKACRLVRPGAQLPPKFDDQEIQIIEQCQIEPLLVEYNTDGFGDVVIPLLYRPTQINIVDGIATRVQGGNIVVDGYLVEEGTSAYTQLQAIAEAMDADPLGYGKLVNCELPPVTGSGIVGYSQIVLDSLTGQLDDQTQMGEKPPFSGVGTSYNLGHNYIKLVFNGALLFTVPNIQRPSGNNLRLFAFATYDRQEYIVPDDMATLQSNRFDIQILTRTGVQVEPNVLNFLIDFLFKIKAFHSLLNVIVYTLELVETYEVNDFCVGGDIKQRYDTDAGKLQVPPAIIPRIPTGGDCNVTPTDLGYKPEDIQLREFKLTNLAEEHAAWKALDSRAGILTGNQSIDSRLDQPVDNLNRTECKFNDRGQDMILPAPKTERQDNEFNPGPNANGASVASEPNLAESPVQDAINGEFDPVVNKNGEYDGYGSFNVERTDDPTPFCEDDGVTDFCYRGRVNGELLHQEAIVNNESVRFHPCRYSMGSGLYYTYPTPTKIVAANTPLNYYSGKAKAAGLSGFLESVQRKYLTAPYNQPLAMSLNSFIGRLLRAYDTPKNVSLHYTNRNRFVADNAKQTHFLAIQRPELDIEITSMHFPGCRFPTMNRLQNDHTSIYKARPWDDEYSTYCGPITRACSNRPTFLNARLEINTAGDEYLVFDDVQLVYHGNNMPPDVSSLGDQTVPGSYGSDWDSSYDVVHAVYLGQAASHPAITLDAVCEPSLSSEDPSGDGELQANENVKVQSPLFQSAGKCSDGTYLDYSYGYACRTGYQDRGDTSIDRDGLYSELYDALGIPHNDAPSTADTLFFLISGIRVTTGIRLDCGCSKVDCNSTDATASSDLTGMSAQMQLACNAELFRDEDGERNWDCDHVAIDTRIVLDELVGVHSHKLDGTIPTLFELLNNCCTGQGSAITK